jgi:hypothetical protein
MRKTFLILGIILSALAIVAISLRHRANEVAPWPEQLAGVRLEPARPVLSEEEVTEDNAYYYIRQLTNYAASIKMTDEEGRALGVDVSRYALTDPVFPNFEEWIARNQDALRLFHTAAAMTNCQVPTINSYTSLLPYINPVLKISKIMTGSTRRRAASGDWVGFQDDIVTCLKISDHVARGGPLISGLVGLAIQRLAYDAIRQCALEFKMPVPVAKDLLQFMTRRDEQAEPFSETLRYEWVGMCGTLELVFHPRGNEHGLGDPDLERILRILSMIGSGPKQTKKHFDAIYSHIIDMVDQPFDPKRYEREIYPFLEGSDLSFPTLVFSQDPVGRVLVLILMPSLQQAQERYVSSQVDSLITKTVIAICQFRDMQGRLPDTLAELCPAYFATVPTDPLSRPGAPLQYRQESDRWTVYSVGLDQEDNGGRYNWLDYKLRDGTNALDICFSSDEFALKRAASTNVVASAQ